MKSKLETEIITFLNDNGFKDYQRNLNKLDKISSKFSSKFKDMFNFKKALGGVAGNPLVQMAGGYLTVTGAIGQYNKMIEASNYQIEQETKLYSTLRGQGFRDEQIEDIKNYASELQKVGVVGDEVTLSGVQQLATYNLTSENLKKLMPAMADVLVQMKGLKGGGQDAVGVANMLAKGLLGQVGILKKAGITLTNHQTQLIKTGNQEQKVAALVEAVTMNVGKQNAEFLKTPEGKIASVHNRIGDAYEDFGMILRETRANFWDFMSENLDMIKPFTENLIKVLAGGFDTFMNTTRFLFNTLANMPQGAKTTIKLISGFFMIKKFPIVAGIMIIEDILGAFQGKDSVIEDCFNALTKFANSDYKFEDLRKGVKGFFDIIINDGKKASLELSETAKNLYRIYSLFAGALNLPSAIGSGARVGLEIVNNFLSGKELDDDLDKKSVENLKDFRNNLSGVRYGMDYNSYLTLQENEREKKLKRDIEEATKKDKYKDISYLKSGVIPLNNENIKAMGITNRNNYKNPALNLPEIQQPQFINLKELKGLSKKIINENKKIEIKSSPVININVTAESNGKIAEKVKSHITQALDDYNEKLKVQVGGDYMFSSGGAI